MTESWADTRATQDYPAKRQEKYYHHSPMLLPTVKQETCMSHMRAEQIDTQNQLTAFLTLFMIHDYSTIVPFIYLILNGKI